MINITSKTIKDQKLIIDDKSHKLNEEILIESLKIYSSISVYKDNIWILDKKIKERNGDYHDSKIYFNQCSKNYINIIKEFALLRLNDNKSISTIRTDLDGINFLTNFMDENNSKTALNEISKKILFSYKEYLENSDLSVRTKESKWTGIRNFFKTLSIYGFENQYRIIGRSNPFSLTITDKVDNNIKLIPKEVAIQLDRIFIDTNIPLPFRVMYWICRLIPNRITEVASMRLNCIRPYINELALSIPMFKQNGGYITAEIRMIAIEEIGVGKYLLDLIREQIELSKKLQEKINDDDKGFLFTYIPYFYYSKKKEYKIFKKHKPILLNIHLFNNFLKRICKRNNVMDINGEIYSLSSHKFRHNAITDRLCEGFRVIDIMSLTHHKSSQMIINNYTHTDENILKEKANKVINEDKPTVLFKGHIINSDNDLKWERIMRRPFAHKIGKLGICGDISGCESDMYECLDCDLFVPNADELDYFEEEVRQWESKVKKFPNHPYMKENAEYNLKLNQKIVAKIKKALT